MAIDNYTDEEDVGFNMDDLFADEEYMKKKREGKLKDKSPSDTMAEIMKGIGEYRQEEEKKPGRYHEFSKPMDVSGREMDIPDYKEPVEADEDYEDIIYDLAPNQVDKLFEQYELIPRKDVKMGAPNKEKLDRVLGGSSQTPEEIRKTKTEIALKKFPQAGMSEDDKRRARTEAALKKFPNAGKRGLNRPLTTIPDRINNKR